MLTARATDRIATRTAFLLCVLLVVLGTIPRKGFDSWAQPVSLRADQQVVLITGSTGGLGREVAYRVAASGAHVIVHGRNVERGNEVVKKINDEGMGSARFYRVDLADLEAVAAFADSIRAHYDRLDILINNAGMNTLSVDRLLNSDGYELLFTVNYLSGYLLTRELLPLLISSEPSRVINVASRSQIPIDFQDPMLEIDYSGRRAYRQSKLAQIMHAIDLSHELKDTGVVVVSLHPAGAMDTDMVVKDLGVEPQSSVHDGANALMRLVDGSHLVSGQFYFELAPGTALDQAYDEEARAQLKDLSERLIQEALAETVH